ncbi:DUF58 domain-containing protein [Butyrivibrio sp. LC3010]|uniref:DUF58 domain-containing protein n=1 Tax=Butyrivibrio sp. LC3010 TaxID=1280680 RepID=UPI00040F75EA|nr:DUF58 domain-containing protein [Butyrivibrio sp. LC3010]
MKINYKRLFIYLIILIASVVWASYMGGTLPYMCLFTMLFYLPLSVIYILVSNYFFQTYQELPSRRVMKNEEQPYELVIEDAGFFRINDARLITEENLATSLLDSDRLINLTPGKRVVIKGKVKCRYAGIYNVGLVNVCFYDPFYIYGAVFQIPSPYRVTVMPMITEVANRVLDFENLKNSSRIRSLVLKEPVPGNEFRPYKPGDPLKSIHWKASASAGELISRIPDTLELRSVVMVLVAENSISQNSDTDFIKRRDYFLEFAVSAAYYFAQKGESIRILYPRGELKDVQVASLDGFSEFYEDISKGPFYNREKDMEKLEAQSGSIAENEQDSIVITVREHEYGTEHFLEIRNSD